MKKFHIVTLGCPKNEADMDILRGIFESNGYSYVEDPGKADFIFVDTCGFIERAKEESIDTIFEYSALKEKNPKVKIIPIGCLIERYYDDFKNELREVDGLIGVVPPNFIFENVEKGNYFVKLDAPLDVYKCETRYVPPTAHAFVKIGDGCSRKCAFCSIPYFKGEPMSREIEDIKHEVEFLVKNGKKEIILVSQDNTLYGIDLYQKQALPDLLEELNNIEGDFWIRVMYLHPDFLNDEIIETIHKLGKVVKYFDVPMQHGSDNVLKSMGRVKNTEKLLELTKKIRKVPSILRTSIIVGFPGESEEDFEKLIDFVDKVEFDKLGVFTYSQEEGTPAFTLKDDVSEETKNIRLEKVMELQKDISEEKLERYIGQTFKVLIEEYQDGVYVGRTFMDAPEIDGNVFFKSAEKLNLKDFTEVKITSASEYDLEGESL